MVALLTPRPLVFPQRTAAVATALAVGGLSAGRPVPRVRR
ncbi:hypothetical protein DFP74_3712 [Nocardiopsis sp. Huas11]|nr:hypothetical protein DFP74_3712 [Nocardiopsis sp. Huas11]